MKKILIIEDDKNIAKALTVRFNKLGYDVAATYDAVMATTKAHSFEPDLILMDIALPGGDGFILVDRLRQIDNTADVPVVFITASKKQGLREQARKIGAAGFFEKPFNAGELMGLVGQLI